MGAQFCSHALRDAMANPRQVGREAIETGTMLRATHTLPLRSRARVQWCQVQRGRRSPEAVASWSSHTTRQGPTACIRKRAGRSVRGCVSRASGTGSQQSPRQLRKPSRLLIAHQRANVRSYLLAAKLGGSQRLFQQAGKRSACSRKPMPRPQARPPAAVPQPPSPTEQARSPKEPATRQEAKVGSAST